MGAPTAVRRHVFGVTPTHPLTFTLVAAGAPDVGDAGVLWASTASGPARSDGRAEKKD